MTNLDHDFRFAPEDPPAVLDGAGAEIIATKRDRTVNPEHQVLGDGTLARNNAVGAKAAPLDEQFVRRHPGLQKQLRRVMESRQETD